MKKFVILLFVLVLASSSVWAFQGWDLFGKKSSKELLESSEAQEIADKSQEAIEEVQADLQEKLTENEAESSGNEQSETSNQLKTVVEEYSTTSKLNKKQMVELMDKLTLVSDDIDLLIADNIAKEEEIYRVKFYADGGVSVGFRNATDKVVPTLGFIGNAGVKLSNGMKIGTGLQYMMVDFAKPNGKLVDFGWDISRLNLNATVGYEW